MESVIWTYLASLKDSVEDITPVSAMLLNSLKICGKVVNYIFIIPSGSASNRGVNQVTPKKNGVKNGQMKQRDDECFGDSVDDFLDTDFDFEGNLALFDKAAVFSEIDISERRNGVRSRGTPQEQTPTRYRHDENILEAKPVVYRQITVPQPGAKEYCTGKCFILEWMKWRCR